MFEGVLSLRGREREREVGREGGREGGREEGAGREGRTEGEKEEEGRRSDRKEGGRRHILKGVVMQEDRRAEVCQVSPHSCGQTCRRGSTLGATSAARYSSPPSHRTRPHPPSVDALCSRPGRRGKGGDEEEEE